MKRKVKASCWTLVCVIWGGHLRSSSSSQVLGVFWRRSHHLLMVLMTLLPGNNIIAVLLKPFQGVWVFHYWMWYMHTFLTGLPSANFHKAKTQKLFSWIFPKWYLIYYFHELPPYFNRKCQNLKSTIHNSTWSVWYR